jgi:hypothetical protein
MPPSCRSAIPRLIESRIIALGHADDGGKYYILLKPRRRNGWYMFLNEMVAPIDIDKTLAGYTRWSYGRPFSTVDTSGWMPNREHLPYILVYFRVDQLDDLLDW